MAKKKILLNIENVGDKRINKHSSLSCNMTNRPDLIKKETPKKINQK